MLTNYDPNGYALQRVRIQYQLRHWKGEVVIEVRGTDRGLETMEWALEQHWEQLAAAVSGDCPPCLVLLNDEGDEELQLEDEMLLQVDWLKEYVVGIEILSIEPCERSAEEGRTS